MRALCEMCQDNRSAHFILLFPIQSHDNLKKAESLHNCIFLVYFQSRLLVSQQNGT